VLDLPHNLKNYARLVLSFFFCQFFLVELNNFLDRLRTIAKIFSDRDQFLQHDRLT
jgi:hypothetical protein